MIYGYITALNGLRSHKCTHKSVAFRFFMGTRCFKADATDDLPTKNTKLIILQVGCGDLITKTIKNLPAKN